MPARFDRPVCDTCPFRDGTKVLGEGDRRAQIALIGEAPGVDEELAGRPFVGRAGKVLDVILKQARVPRQSIWLTNVLCHRPPRNDIHCWEAVEAVETCGRPGLMTELSSLTQVKVLVPMGNTSMEALGLGSGILSKRGSVYEIEIPERGNGRILAVPTVHPAYVARDWSAKWKAVADIKKARRLAEGGQWRAPREDFLLNPRVEDLEVLRDRLHRSGDPVAVDIETTGLTPDHDIVVIGLGVSGERAVAVPLLQRGGVEYSWGGADRRRALSVVRELLAVCPTVFQNAIFDVPFLEAHGFTVGRLQEDTILLYHAINSEPPHTLSHIVSLYGHTPYWKEPFTNRDGGILDMADEDLRTYNLRDCVVLHQILPNLYKDARHYGVDKVYREISMPLLRVCIDMKERGIGVSQNRVKKWREELEAESRDLDSRLRSTAGLPPQWNPDSDDDLRSFLFGVQPGKYRRAAQTIADREAKALEKPVEKRASYLQRTRSTKLYQQAKAIVSMVDNIEPLYPWSGAGIRTRATVKTRKPAVDAQSLLSLRIALNNRLAQLKSFRRQKTSYEREKNQITRLLDWLTLYGQYAKVAKLLSTYTHFPTWSDGRVHPDWLPHGTATGRLAARRPNVQNQPEASRRVFVAGRGREFAQLDYSNLELRLAAILSGDEPLKQTFAAGINVHDQNTRDLFGIDKNHPEWSTIRVAAKTYIFGRNYGGSLHGIYEKVMIRVPQLEMTFAHFKEVDERYRSLHPAYASWFDRTAEEVRANRRLTNPFGRVRIFRGSASAIVREGVNYPIQSSAADIINLVAIDLDLPDDVYLIAQIHDALLLDYPTDLREDAIGTVKARMEAPVKIYDQHHSFPVDAAYGPSWDKDSMTEWEGKAVTK